MKKFLLFIPPLAHLLGFKDFLFDKNINLITKFSVFTENIFLYFLAGMLFYFGRISFIEMLAIVVSTLLVLSPLEYAIIKKLNKAKLNIVTNWGSFKSFKHYFINQYQVCGYIFIGYILAMILI